MKNRKESRRYLRRVLPLQWVLGVMWQDANGTFRSLEARALDISEKGARIECSEPLESSTHVSVKSDQPALAGSATVCYCVRRGTKYFVGLQYLDRPARENAGDFDPDEDYYEILQISPNAQADTILRVYRILATRYHPDNPETGSTAKFLLIRRAYEVLSDPDKRGAYDEFRRDWDHRALPAFGAEGFLDDAEAEPNRRLGILFLLYQRRRLDPDNPSLSLLDLENIMSLPREHLLFSVWYLKEKECIRVDQSSSGFAITAAGVDTLENRLPGNPVLHRLLEAPRTENLRPNSAGRAAETNGNAATC